MRQPWLLLARKDLADVGHDPVTLGLDISNALYEGLLLNCPEARTLAGVGDLNDF